MRSADLTRPRASEADRRAAKSMWQPLGQFGRRDQTTWQTQEIGQQPETQILPVPGKFKAQNRKTTKRPAA